MKQPKINNDTEIYVTFQKKVKIKIKKDKVAGKMYV